MNLITQMDDPIRDALAAPSKVPLLSVPLGRLPLGIYDIPNAIRAVWSKNINDVFAVTTFNLLPFGRFAVDGYKTV
jgi:hypothetical protein